MMSFMTESASVSVIPTSTSRPGPSSIGALIGGLLMLVLGVVVAVGQFLSSFGWSTSVFTYLSFGTLPGQESSTLGCSPGADGCQLTNLVSISRIVTGAVWVALGIVIIILAKRRLSGVAIFGLIAVLLFLTEPMIEFVAVYPQNLSSPVNWLYVISTPILLPVALLFIALAGRPNRSPGMSRIAAIVLLILAEVSFVLYGILFMVPLLQGLTWSFFMATTIFIAAWIIIAATIRSKH